VERIMSLGNQRPGRKVTAMRVIIELEPVANWLNNDYFNANRNLMSSFVSAADFDVRTLRAKLPALLSTLDLNGRYRIRVEYEKEASDEESAGG
jgi:hypothetical protein